MSAVPTCDPVSFVLGGLVRDENIDPAMRRALATQLEDTGEPVETALDAFIRAREVEAFVAANRERWAREAREYRAMRDAEGSKS